MQAFLGFANFYKRFILAFSTIAAPLTRLTKKGVNTIYPLALDSKEFKAFEILKKAFTVAPVLAHFNPDLEIWIETDTSDFVVATVLS